MYNLKEFKNIFDPLLNNFVDKKMGEFLKSSKDPFIKDLGSYSKNLITGGGKRMRPYLAYLAYKSFGGRQDDKAINFFISLELFHNFLLIHDDVMDKGQTRHGQTTIHTHVLEKLNQNNRVGDLKHIANSQAILIGDLLFSWSMEFFTSVTNFDLENLTMAKKYFHKTVDEVILGQIIDVDLSTRTNPSWDLIEEKTRLKTSRYSFVRPMQIGAILANPSYGNDDFFEKLGTKLGIAFQIQDDLLDIIGNPSEIRKTPLIDIAEHQHTFFTNYILENGTKNQKEYFNGIFGKSVVKEQEEKIRNLFIESGSIEAGKKLIEENFREAKKIIENSKLENEYKQKFLELIAIIENRKN